MLNTKEILLDLNLIASSVLSLAGKIANDAALNEAERALKRAQFKIIPFEKTNEQKIKFAIVDDKFLLNKENARLKIEIRKLKEKNRGISKGLKTIRQKGVSMETIKNCSIRRKENGIWEVRYRRNGLNKSFSNKNKTVAVAMAKEFLEEIKSNIFSNNRKSAKSGIMFKDFAEQWFEIVKKPNLTEMSYYNYRNKYKNYILPIFENVRLKDVSAIMIQKTLNDIIEKGFDRTAEDVKLIISGILQYAADNELIKKNPVSAVKIQKHYRETGKALELNEEKSFVKSIIGHPYELNFILALYCGVRPCEINTFSFTKDKFITFENKKQKTRKTVYKHIPISPMLAPFIHKLKNNELKVIAVNTLSKCLKDMNLNFTLKDLRHTFASRCQMLGVSQPVVAEWMGHSRKALMTDAVYTHYDDNFMIKEIKKIKY